jgi:hypothetical protein
MARAAGPPAIIARAPGSATGGGSIGEQLSASVLRCALGEGRADARRCL